MAKNTKAKLEKKNGGYYFPELKIHVVARTEEGARRAVKVYHGIDPDQKAAELKKTGK